MKKCYEIIITFMLVTLILMHIDWWQFIKPPAIYLA